MWLVELHVCADTIQGQELRYMYMQGSIQWGGAEGNASPQILELRVPSSFPPPVYSCDYTVVVIVLTCGPPNKNSWIYRTLMYTIGLLLFIYIIIMLYIYITFHSAIKYACH